jgi:uncharacterized membrane protein
VERETCALFTGNHVILLCFFFLIVLWKQFPPPRRWCPLLANELIDTSRELVYCRKASCRNVYIYIYIYIYILLMLNCGGSRDAGEKASQMGGTYCRVICGTKPVFNEAKYPPEPV